MARFAAWLLGFGSALGWTALLVAAGVWLLSPPQGAEVFWLIGLWMLIPVPLMVALALRRGDLNARPLRAACGAGLAVGGFLALLLLIAVFAAPFLLLHPVGWALFAMFFLIPVVVWPIMFRRASRTLKG